MSINDYFFGSYNRNKFSGYAAELSGIWAIASAVSGNDNFVDLVFFLSGAICYVSGRLCNDETERIRLRESAEESDISDKVRSPNET